MFLVAFKLFLELLKNLSYGVSCRLDRVYYCYKKAECKNPPAILRFRPEPEQDTQVCRYFGLARFQ